MAALPSSQTPIHVALSHVTSFTPAGLSNAGHIDQVAAARIPTGCAHSVDRRLTASNASQ